MSGAQDGPRTGDGDGERSHPITESAPEWVDSSTDEGTETDADDTESADESSGDADSTKTDDDKTDDRADTKARKSRKVRRARPVDTEPDDPFGPTPPWLQRGTGRRSLVGLSITLVLVMVVAGLGWLLFSGDEEATAEPDDVTVDSCGVTEHDDEGLVIAPPRLGTAADRATATITTNYGDITVLLFGDVAPCGVSGFNYLAAQGFYTNNDCYRISTQPAEPTVTLRCGDPQGTGNGGPGYRFRAEQKFEGQPAFDAFALINNETGQAGSSFAFIRGQAIPTASLSVIGQVISGFEILDQIGASAGLDSYDGVPPQQVMIMSVTITEGTVTLPPTELPGTEIPAPSGTHDPSDPSLDPSQDPSQDPTNGPSMPGIPGGPES